MTDPVLAGCEETGPNGRDLAWAEDCRDAGFLINQARPLLRVIRINGDVGCPPINSVARIAM
jgi:hypothetical protein